MKEKFRGKTGLLRGGNRLANPYGESSGMDSGTLLGSRAEKKLCCLLTVAAQQWQKQSYVYLRLPAKSRKVACHLLPDPRSSGASYAAQIVKTPQHPVTTPKATHHHGQPAGNKPWTHQTFRIHRLRGAPKAPLAQLPTSKTHKQRPNDRTHRVLKVGNQLDWQKRKRPMLPSTQKARNGNPLPLETWK
jgi:hypothetical protein